LVQVVLVCFALIASTAATEQQDEAESAKSDSWAVRVPYPDNPLKEAVLTSTLHFDNREGRAELRIQCRPGTGRAWLNMLVPTAASNFDFSRFEGPGGLGERHKLLTLKVGTTFEQMHRFSGYYVEGNAFVFSFALSPFEASRLTSKSAERQLVTVTILPPKRNRMPLKTVFRIPDESEPAREAVRPCLGASP
jgi:hypothetical protein